MIWFLKKRTRKNGICDKEKKVEVLKLVYVSENQVNTTNNMHKCEYNLILIYTLDIPFVS